MKMRKMLSILLALCLTLSMLPQQAQAEQTVETSVDNSNISVEGTNGFGALLSQEISASLTAERETASSYQEGYSVTELTIEGSTAAVTYTAQETATLMVAVYTEDGLQMLASGKTTVSPGETEATVTIEGDIPEYFLATAYLLDYERLEPLCEEYQSDMYTEGMQKLLASTVTDYDPALVWNFDDDDITNFGVFDAAVIRPAAVEGKNRVVTADHTNRYYVIADADETFTCLQQGNIVWYAYGENNILVVKVDTITVDGTTVTITGAELEMEEIFSHLKIEVRADASDAVVNTEQEADFVYDSMVQNVTPRSGDVITDSNIGDPFSTSLKFTIAGDSVSVEAGDGTEIEVGEDGIIVKPDGDAEIEDGGDDESSDDSAGDEESKDDNSDESTGDGNSKEDENENEEDLGPELNFDIEGSVDISMDIEFYYYIVDTWNVYARHSNVKFDMKMVHEFDLSVKTEIKQELSAPEFGIAFLGGVVKLSVKPTFEVAFEVECTFRAFVYPRIGFWYKTGEETKNLSEWWKAPAVGEPSISGKFSVGVKFEGAISLLDAGEVELLKIYLEAGATASITAVKGGTSYTITTPEEDARGVHLCECCYEISVDLELELSVGAEILECIKPKLTLLDPKWRLVDMFFSATAREEGKDPFAGFGECPYWRHRLTVEVKDAQGQKVEGASVTMSNGETKLTDENGLAVFFVQRGDYTISALVNGETLTRNVLRLEQSLKVSLNSTTSGRDALGATFDDFVTQLDREAITSYSVVKSGRCGENVFYTIDSNGSLYIYGQGPMYDEGEKLYLYCFDSYDIRYIEIAPGVTRIGYSAFAMCTHVEEVSVPNTVTSIGELAFWCCSSLTEIQIPDSVVEMENCALASCESLTTVEIPESVTSFGGAMFWNCYDLESVKLPSHLPSLPAETFWNCSSLTDVVIPDGVTAIGVKVFMNCSELQELTIPSGVTWLGERVFQGCSKLEEMDIPTGVEYVGPYAFMDCYALTELVIPEGVTSIGEYTFYCCRGLEKLVLPSTVESIGDCAFYNCESLTSLKLPEGIPSLGWQAFAHCYSLEELEIPASVQSIGENAFAYCRSLKKINIPEGITTIGRCWFDGCTSLLEVEIPDSVTAIDYNAFNNCKSLMQIDLPDGLKSIGISAFAYCLELVDITLPQGLSTIDSDAFNHCESLLYLEIPDSVQSIGEYAFANCELLAEMTIPDGITTISNHLFNGCKNLERVVLPDSVTEIGNSAFRYCYKLGSISIPENVTSIGYSAFSDCDALTEVILPGSLVSLSNNLFDSCDNLVRVSVPGGVGTIGNYAFSNCKALEHVNIPDGVTAIGTNAFWNCESLEEVTLPSGLTVIASGLFSNCKSLAIVVIPDDVTAIESNAFGGCKSLTTITIPENVETIKYGAFNYCNNLSQVIFKGDFPNISGNIFWDMVATVYYPAGNSTWMENGMQDYGGTITWVPYTMDANGQIVPNDTAGVTTVPSGDAAPVEVEYLPAEEEADPMVTEEIPVFAVGSPAELPSIFAADLLIPVQPGENATPDAVFGGDYSGVITDAYTVYTATFTGLVPEREYIMLSLVSLDVEDVLASENLLSILQGTAGEDGTLVFQYVQRVDADISYVVACGASNKNLMDAEITFHEMTADGSLQVVNPTVVYDGETLTEGVDYEITGTVDFTEPGEYTCQIRGIHNYTGTVTCTYTVTENSVLIGDVNGDGNVNTVDAMLVLQYAVGMLTVDDLVLAAADANQDGTTNTIDAMLILQYAVGLVTSLPVK